jgi:transaldolase
MDPREDGLIQVLPVRQIADLRVKIYADGADLAGIEALAAQPFIKGFTTNPTLMRKAGVTDYAAFARDVIRRIGDRPISFEVFSDDFDEMEAQAIEISRWAPNVYVKIPVSNTRGAFAGELISRLAGSGIKLNVTALMTPAQVEQVAARLTADVPSCVSLFAGRVADTGRDPLPMIRESVGILQRLPRAELIWASPRELLNIFQADEAGCHIITVTSDILQKLPLVGKDMDEFSLETVRMFHDDAARAGFAIPTSSR